MEKQRIKSAPRSCRRLLTLLALSAIFTLNLFSQNLTLAEINKLQVVAAEDQELFTKVDLKFEVSIPKVKPSQIQVMSTTLPSDVSFRTVRKIQDYENGGTKIEVWYTFDKPGTYQLPRLPLMIQNRRRNIPFQEVSVSDDPSKQIPKMLVIFDNGYKLSSSDEVPEKAAFACKLGTKLNFTVYLQYSTQLVQFYWDLPKDSIFTQTETFEFTEVKYREKKYSHDLIPVASFEWIGLSNGEKELPKIKITATGYNGYRNELLLPRVMINFTPADIDYEDSEDKIFSTAFSSNTSQDQEESHLEITDQLCLALADLYSQERNSLFGYLNARKARINLESDLGLPSTSSDNYSILWLLGSIIFTLVFLILFIISIKKHHLIRVLIFATAMLIGIVSIFYSLGQRMHSFGICTGATISSVPEVSAEAISEISAGNRVEIKEKAGKWYYIELGQTGGWCLQDNIILIK
ncbi:MAG: hypothetical protein K6C97_08200 [Treponema sp.]|nr:hypothetical protein [Treponema sp.]